MNLLGDCNFPGPFAQLSFLGSKALSPASCQLTPEQWPPRPIDQNALPS